MAESFKTLGALLLLLGLFHVGHPLTAEELGQNLCAANPSQPDDNLSCFAIGTPLGTACLNRTRLCDGIDDCGSGIDEGGSLFSALVCKLVPVRLPWFYVVSQADPLPRSTGCIASPCTSTREGSGVKPSTG